MSTKYNAFALVALLLAGNATALYAQEQESRHAQQLESVAKRMAELSTAIAKDVTASLQEIDFAELARESEKLARISAEEAQKITRATQREIEAIDFSELHRELAGIQAEIGSNLGNLGDLSEQWSTTEAAPYQEEKVIEKVYKVDGKDKLSIDNRYGRITVNNWNRNEFKVVVTIKVGESSERRAREALDRVTISDTKTRNEIQFKTSIAAAETGWFANLTGGRNQELSINYEVFMPAGNELSLSNSYGAIETGDREGKLDVSVRYGSLKTGRLAATHNAISASYSKVNIASAREAEISVNYGGLTLGEIGKATISLSYSGNGKIDAINESADISLRYSGGLAVGLGPDIKRADIAASYSSVSISPAKNAAFDFNTAVSYGSFNYGPSATVSQANNGTTSKQYTGYWNKTSPNSVNISARYGSVTLK